MPHRTVAAVTSTRADYGLLRPVLQKLAAAPDCTLRLAVTGAHLCPWLGRTVTEIEADADIAARIDAWLDIFTETPEPVAQTIARTVQVFDAWFAGAAPDTVLLLGDRFEIFAVAIAAAARGIPIAHISGGDVTRGAADDWYRHCITQMSALHFPSNAESAARLVRMGAAPETVYNVGGLGDENLRALTPLPRAALAQATGLPQLMGPFGLVTLHPETALGAPGPAALAQALTAALDNVPDVFWLCTGSNADAGGAVCTAALRGFAAARPGRAAFVQSLGVERYLSALRYAAVAAGNSSSGVVETPTFGVPAVNIGDRQAGRPICQNVLCCPAEAGAITAALRTALTPAFAAKAHAAVSPYRGEDTSGQIVQTLLTFDFARPRVFYDGV